MAHGRRPPRPAPAPFRLDDEEAVLPDAIEDLFAYGPTANPLLTFMWGDIHVASHAFAEEQMEDAGP